MGCQINTVRNLDAAEELSTVTVCGLPNKNYTKFRYARGAIHGYVGCQINTVRNLNMAEELFPVLVGCQINTVRNLDLEEGAINE